MRNKLNTFVGGLTILVLAGLVMPVSLVLAAPSEFISGNTSIASVAEFAPGELVVKYKNDNKPFRVVRLPKGSNIVNAAAAYNRNPNVEYAEPNYIARAFFSPNDTYYSYQWHLDNPVNGGINTETAWDTSAGAGVTVAVIDTGVAYEDFDKFKQAPDLVGTSFVAGYDFVNNDTHPNDDEGHGTHVTGTVAQATDNNLGVAGVAFEATIMPVKVLDRNGSGTYTQVADGIYFAANNGADVINLSLGGSASSQTLLDAVAYAYAKGVTIVAAAGNDGSSTISYPAAYDSYVIAVGATRYDETLSYYSNYGSSLDIVAPGGDMRVDQNGDGYGDGVLQQTFGRKVDQFGYYFYQGTSMASPHAAGVAALVIANGVSGPDNVRAALETTAEDLGAGGFDTTYGWGLVDAAAALTYVPAPVDSPPSVSVTSPPDAATVVGSITISASASDDVGVTQVDFYIDGGLIGSDTVSPYDTPWDSTTVADGNHSITATAIDTASQSTSDSISVFVDNINDPPVADAGADQTVSDSDGSGTESVTLDGSSSYDLDGTIVSYEWTEGATVLATTASTILDFAVGSHTITLTVTDDDSATDTDTAAINVLANQAPTADAGPDQSAFVGDTVSFDGSGSSDPDGTIVSYDWDFGDSATASGVAVSHAYSAEGTYTVTLTVTDSGGLTDSDTAIVSITTAPVGATTVSVDSIAYAPWAGKTSNLHLAIVVALIDDLGNPVSGAAVSIDLNRDDSSLYAAMTGTTNDTGQVTFKARKIPSGCYETVVTSVSASGLTWDGVTPANSYCK